MVGRKLSNEEIGNFFDYNLCRGSRTLYLGSIRFDADGTDLGVETLMYEFFYKGIHILARDSKKPIKVVLNTIGGEWGQGMAIYDAIQTTNRRRIPVDIIGTGNVMSMGAIILQAGRKRYLTSNASVLVHKGQTGISSTLKHDDAQVWAAYEKYMAKEMYRLLAERSGKTPQYWETKSRKDLVLNAREAVEEGLADKVLGNGSQIRGLSFP
jgi:ATP-dependent Clp protease, protease subunit